MEPIGIAEARRRLPELAARVARRVGEVVVIENQRRGERVMLAAEAYVRNLEAIVAETREGRGAFVLAGSMSSGLDGDALEQAMRDLRREAEAARLRRLDGIAESG